ncbi:MAG: hypothetical protein HYZ18_04275 [Pseudogulbenkiania sp.]|nr:hypothetical protein [Pseudogulbenkiania sp.]
MALTNAQRQAAYRARHLKEESGSGERLNAVIDLHAKRALERVATCYGVTQRALLEHLLIEAERQAVAQAGGREADYYDGKLRLPLRRNLL